MRNPGFSGYLLSIPAGKEATLRNITIDGGGENDGKTRESLIKVSGNLNIEEDAILENNFVTVPKGTDANGGAIYAISDTKKVVINMTGGIIRNNSAFFGGGVFLLDNTTFNMSGGRNQREQGYFPKYF